MSKFLILVSSLLGLFSACVAQYVQLGQCNNNVQLVQNFNIDQFLGNWYEVTRIGNPSQNGGCSGFEFTRGTNTLDVLYSSVNSNFLEEARGNISQVDNTAQLTLNIPTFENPMDFWILDTDYTIFSIAFSCENISTAQRRLHIWVLGRTRTLTAMSLALIETTIRNTFNIEPTEVLTSVDQSEESCYILPVIEPGQPIILPGQCDPNLPVVQNFNVERFLGTWHQISSYYTENSDGTCARAEYSLGDGVVDVLNSQVINNSLLTIEGSASVISTDNSAKLSVLFNISGVAVTQELWVLASDYENYAISYTCVNVSLTEKRVFSWILSRTRQLPASSQAAVDSVVNSIMDLNYLYYIPTNQTDAGCFFYPEPVPGQSVTFRGQCESLDVQAMPAFDAASYMGLWHTIEQYPSDTQGGTCSNAMYQLVGGTVSVVNTQVVNQSLDVINAVAVPVSTDGSAQLNVTFPIPGTTQTITTNYWVLGTDYTSYALVYSCFNLNNDEMRVTSWKLSRTKQLAAASETAINNIINNVLVLEQRYYEVMDQSTTGCFYFPEPQPGVPVVFPGQCDTNVTAVQNFNLSQFQGTWYEIQAYPKVEQTGQCINHQYTFVNNTHLNLVSSSVTDQFLGLSNGSVTFTNNDNSGNLTISIVNADGSVITIPFWILSTDYTDYALAYACVNIREDFRGVWSWKLSRTQQLSAAANTAISNIVANNLVLDNDYYETIDQSESACAYLPDLEAGSIITIPGQCDTTITGIPNFNLARYAGRWRLIESYGSSFQTGTCNVDEYTQETTLTLGVTNTQVVNQELISISGTAIITSVDGSGRLLFTLPNGQVSEIFILDTDYDSYALAYGCVNVNSEQRTISSWKFSRSNSLSQVAINNMNQIINSIEVLNNRYYYTVNRTEAGCFYYPPFDSTGVRFRTACNQNIPVVANFQPARYLGLWHDIESYPEVFQMGTCQNALYTPGNDVDVYNTQVIDQTLFDQRGFAMVNTTDGTGILNVTFNVNGIDVTANYLIMATDYDSYAFVYSCRPIDDEYVQVTSWKLSRTKALTAAAVTAINNVMNNIPVLDQRYFIARNQTPEGCFYFPEPQPGVPVEFPGQCDDSIAAVPNFDMTRFQGLWHEIQAYPKEEQPGQCINHRFTLSGTTANTLDLQSSNVFGLALGITNGTVTFNSTDGSGRLLITIQSDIGEVIQIPYWIISTDYDNYALAYSCVNVNTDYRRVWGWKLSRTQQLTAASTAAINTAMENINVLANTYFEDIDQSDQACFHLPNLTPGEPVVLPGLCDTNIRGVSNFNIARFAGRWRLIENYGTDFQRGTCNVARYTLESATTLSFVSSQVMNQELATLEGNATIVSTDGTGVLVFYYPSRDEYYNVTILDTDYDSYALGYSCVNLSNNQRRVYSWKFSRDNTLSTAAINNINAIINSIEVLHNPYYYTVDRSDAGCFYYPPFDSNGVRFRTACNQNIPVVVNFEPARYLGLWHDIESYPEVFQMGTCQNALYTPGNDVDVYNTQVIDQTLFDQRGFAMVNTTDGTGILNVTFNVNGIDVTANYLIMATDYDSYAFVYSCRPIDDEYVQVTSWKLSRTKALTAAAVTAINNVMNNIPVLDQRYFVARNQTPEGCFYFPEPQPGVPVEFPGQCDDSIAAVPNFDITRFQGLWHEIQAYPKEEQPGQCINHRFTLSGTTANTLDLQSSNVFGLALGITNGTVTFNSTDGSGRLVITIQSDIGEVIQIPYWIISTDYDSYALAYSCVNVNTDYRRVWGWKLSRTQQLTAASTAAINTAMENINVLANTYFEDIDQSDQACFYLPNLTPGEPVVLPGQCDTNIRGVSNFNIARYAGRWRLIENYGTDFQGGTCNVGRYTLESATTLSVVYSQVVNQELATLEGSATIVSTDGTGVLVFYFPSRDEYYNVTILDTDYDSYALGYSCVNLSNNQRRVYSWKFSRDNTLSTAAINNINAIINSIEVLHNPYYYTVDRSDAGCFYYPPFDSTGVRFRTACNQNIPVVANFQPARYLGLWHDIESYPEVFQMGTCQNALYTPGNDVDVYNTQVIDQTLFDQRGFAMVNTTDGTGILNVTFNVNGIDVTANYLIMATDYDSYAFVYSCRPIDDEYVQVTSWKLSRTKALTAAAVTAINNVMNNIPVLDQRYFIARNQTPEGCFYFPEPQPGVPVEFPGQCDDSIAAVPNFDMTRFQGLWHEIQAYPKIDQPGQCINHRFTLSGTAANTLDLQSSNVFGLALGITNGTVTFTSTDSSGRLLITIQSDSGEVIEIPYWIISTDYDNYALAYSCVNINSDYRGVWSWKLSRTQQLSAASNTAINNAIANINVLDNIYYENIQQTDNACFYLPELGPNDPVIFPGQCDANIPVVQNFDAARYLGRWRLIEAYYTEFQEGTCDTATYSLADDGSVIVFNTQVIDQQLDTITGSAVLASDDGSGKLLVSFPGTGVLSDYWILDTDYDSYALVYSCFNLPNNQRRVGSWKMSRTNTLSTTATTAINAIVNSINVLHPSYYQVTNRTEAGCFYYPTPDNNTNVIFPGQCDETLPVVLNFNAAAYLGTWYDIESYPVTFQVGTCQTATYSLQDDGTILVQNTEVINQVLDTINGTAVPSFNDGSAKLNVTFFPTNIPSSNYWVLATDYTSYSLVYSCQNIDDEFRAIYSWKLGRERSLSQAAITAINNAMSTVDVLEPQYYIQRQHTEEACFYYPENNGGDVILEGQCEDPSLVPTVTNFNPTSFAGTWYEIARFPSALQDGECVTSQYTLAGANAFNVVLTSVLDETLLTTNTQGGVTTDGRGVISININGVPFDNVFILGTDYNDYALAYSCRNLTANTKQVYSWKMSRSRGGLSNQANTSINQIVADNIDLFEPYYRYTGQDDSSCFYYPVFDQPQSVIELPGACNTTIRGVPNFDAAAYLGRWFDVARYPQVSQNGQCNRAVYSDLGGGVVSVVNSQVVDERLVSITGQATIASTDGSGYLNVVFEVGGVNNTANYYILATDYNSYALVYSCVNLPNGNRQVFSWKLSRSRTLSTQASTAIDAVISVTQGLNENYYQSTSQTDESCFYIPPVNPNQAPLFRGQCEEITGVTGFDANRFLGWWHEIESLPTDDDGGVCRSSRYESSGNTIQVVDTSIFNVTDQTETSSVTITTDGRIRRTFSDGRVQDIWVLETDYDNYALLYSCENVDEEYRRVWSAKHSRTRSLTEAAQTAMNATIQSNRVLYQEFYQQIDQSDSACFHYPSQTGPEVILPGQCDTSIPVVGSFDIDNFQGTWYTIRQYGPVNENSCVGTTLTYDATSGDISFLQYGLVGSEFTTAEATGRLNSTDGSGRITIVRSNGESQDTTEETIYVLSTDYEDYALLYSCVNIDTLHRQVRAWQLSRGRELTTVGASTILGVINEREELYIPYFNDIPHVGECPEPSSAYLINSSIILVLACAVLQLVW